ncbi:MAG: hypothetical protein DRP71_07280 [Verrucomicrobia bacterium]|nr:MAG: hypothetical protein DRP71_07280 [Verrucomicrobiota bacterium]
MFSIEEIDLYQVMLVRNGDPIRNQLRIRAVRLRFLPQGIEAPETNWFLWFQAAFRMPDH